MVKGFGCRQAYESLSCRNPRAIVGGYGDFDLWPMSALARSALGSAAIEADWWLCCAAARYCLPDTRLLSIVVAAIVGTDACGFVAGGLAPAATV